MTDGTAVTDTYSITINDQTLGPFPTGPDSNLDAPVTGRLVRIDADRTTGGKTGATEMEIYRTG